MRGSIGGRQLKANRSFFRSLGANDSVRSPVFVPTADADEHDDDDEDDDDEMRALV